MKQIDHYPNVLHADGVDVAHVHRGPCGRQTCRGGPRCVVAEEQRVEQDAHVTGVRARYVQSSACDHTQPVELDIGS